MIRTLIRLTKLLVVGALVGGAAVGLLRPAAYPPVVGTALGLVETETPLLWVAVGAVAGLVTAAITTTQARTRRAELDVGTPELASSSEESVVQRDLEDRIERVRAEGDDAAVDPQSVVADLRRAVVTLVAETEQLPTEAARERVRDGSWTDDAYVAAVLSPDDERRPSLPTRVWEWFLGPRAVARRVARIERALLAYVEERQSGGDTDE
ncbi:DUF7269 family protein [Haloarcula marina]|uniref:DUF7269 family protein n=1 Tax=Haloarcula marina TaxID=2961574 RepID=UPI0020B893AF|nr:hypothetical protein [Halomicroarcula marina]